MATCGIYLINNTVTGKIYIGSSIDIDGRWRSHLSRLKHGKHNSRHLQYSYNVHGRAAFTLHILETVPAERLAAREQAWLDEIKPFHDNNGYNTARDATAANRGQKLSAETRKKMSVATSARYAKRRKDAEAAYRETALRLIAEWDAAGLYQETR